MIIGVPKETKNNENRVSIVPSGVFELKNLGHEILVEKNAGLGSGFTDEDYIKQGAKILNTKEEVYAKSDMILKVKEPQPDEYELFRPGQIMFTYLHLAVEKELTDALLKKKVIGIAYETIEDKNGNLPLLAPMSEIAGRMSIQIGEHFLEKPQGGKGILLSGVPGVKPAKVLIIGGGVVGFNAAQRAVGAGADVTIMDVSIDKLRFIDNHFENKIKTVISNQMNISKEIKNADLVIGAVLIPGGKAPNLITEDMVKTMQKGSVIVDVAIDQGGIVETMDKITTHDNPTFEKYGVLHYAVANIPGAVPRTSTLSITNATLPYVKKLATDGFEKAVKSSKALLKGVNTYEGALTNERVALALGLEFKEISSLIGF